MYVDAIHDRKKDKILVAERVNGQRVYNEVDAEYVFYYEHMSGTHKSIFGDACRKFSTNNGKKFHGELKRIAQPVHNRKPVKIFESDINPVFRSLADHYAGVETPKLHVGYFDIEVDFDPERGFAPTTDPFNPITAISVYLSQLERMVTLVLLPPTMTVAEGQAIVDQFEDTYLFTDEVKMLHTFIDVIEDTDVLTGWNSTGFDIPYIVNRMARIMDRDSTRDLCLWNQLPREREYLKFKRILKTYDLVGRVHLDYLELYQKHNTQQLHSYKLDYVGRVEVKETKVPYDGTLDELYKNDFKKFIEYNRQDTLLLQKIDAKRRYIELSNQIAHGNCVLLKTTMGSVALVEQAIINEMHAMGFVVPDRKRTLDERQTFGDVAGDDDDEDEDGDIEDDGRTPVVGAYVANPKKGLHDEIGCVDINSLYPSVIRALNMSPETIIGQVRIDATMALISERVAKLGPKRRAEAWEGVFACLEVDAMHECSGMPITIDYEDGTTRTMSARQFYDYVFNPDNHICVTANGTLFDTRKSGILPQLLAKWYAERKQMQGKEKAFGDRASGEPIEDWQKPILEEAGIPVEGELTKEQKSQCKFLEGFWNQRQQARKILLNSLYGALLNEGLRFYDERLGQSVTLTGRSIVRHMNAEINKIITGTYQHDGDAIIYSDTDSSYFTAIDVLRQMPDYDKWTRSDTVVLYDDIANECNKTFPAFMKKTFNTTLERGGIIAAGRELVASKGLFIKKKKYAVLMYDKEGRRYDIDKEGNTIGPGKLKVMGLDMKRADTPVYMQEFLEKLLLDLLSGADQDNLYTQIKKFRNDFTSKPGWDKGTPKKVNALFDYVSRKKYAANLGLMESAKLKPGTKVKVNKVWHVEAAMNWNKLCETYGDLYSQRIGDGHKVIVCKLKPNMMKMTHVAYPIDETHIPKWYRELPFDHEAMENTIIDKKLNNLFGVLGWNMDDTKEKSGDEFFIFK